MTGLPAATSTALARRLDRVSRLALRERAQAISDAYRAGGTSDIIRSELDALAYAVVRMPATYAAVRAVLGQTIRIVPDFAPRSLLDVGAGPGTASWAALDAWPSIREAALIDRNAHLLDLARGLRDDTAPHIDVSLTRTDITGALGNERQADVVLAGYALAEIASPARKDVVATLWGLANRLLVIVEPGTMEGFRRVLECRDILLAQGARIIAPCSHEGPCPLAENARWCHFSERLPRSRDHLVTKAASVPYEDEKFIYLAAGKGFDGLARGRRVLASPRVSKSGIALTLCAPGTAQDYVADRRQKGAYKAAKRLGWGDTINL